MFPRGTSSRAVEETHPLLKPIRPLCDISKGLSAPDTEVWHTAAFWRSWIKDTGSSYNMIMQGPGTRTGGDAGRERPQPANGNDEKRGVFLRYIFPSSIYFLVDLFQWTQNTTYSPSHPLYTEEVLLVSSLQALAFWLAKKCSSADSRYFVIAGLVLALYFELQRYFICSLRETNQHLFL